MFYYMSPNGTKINLSMLSLWLTHMKKENWSMKIYQVHIDISPLAGLESWFLNEKQIDAFTNT